MTDTPKVSIIVAAYNVAFYLPRCIRSLLDQTEESIEVVIVDDGSTDATTNLADYYASIDPRVRVIHQVNGGLSVARNTGLLSASGQFVCFIDGDDWAEPDMIRSMTSACENSLSTVAIAGIYVDTYDQNESLVASERRYLTDGTIHKWSTLEPTSIDENFINLLGYAWNKIFLRDWLLDLDIRFEKNLTLVEDIEFNAKVLAAAERVTLVSGTYVHYIQRPRKTLGTTVDEKYLALRMRAIESVDALLRTWGVDQYEREALSARAAGLALWMALRYCTDTSRPKDSLRQMLEQPGVEKLMKVALSGGRPDWRRRWASTNLCRRWYTMGLLPFMAASILSSLRTSLAEQLPSIVRYLGSRCAVLTKKIKR